MDPETRPRGEGAFKVLVGVSLLLLASFATIRIVPVHIEGARVYDAMDEAANFVGQWGVEKTRDVIYRKVRDLGAPVPREAIHVERRGPNVVISAKYERHVSVLVTTYHYEFDKSLERPVF